MKKYLLLLALMAFVPLHAQLDQRAQEVLQYWLGDLQDAEHYPESKMKLWFGKDPQIDEEISKRFKDLILEASNNGLEGWKETAKGRLALLIVLDQFPRHVYRNTSQAFAYDTMAQKWALEGVCQFEDQQLFPIERVFFYLPFEHAENFELQEISVEQFHALVIDAPVEIKPVMEKFAEYAYQHYVIIARFGRFPHRNHILGRDSTPEELEFLQEQGSSF